MASKNSITFEPIKERKLIGDKYFFLLMPFGDSTSVNVLELFLGTPDIETNVMLLGSGDLKNVLMTTAHLTDAYKKVNFHLTDYSESLIARNILMAHIIHSDGFNPSNPTDLQYLWDVWYHLQWNEATKKRFIKDVKQLMAGQWTNCPIHIPDPKGVAQLKEICSVWLETASNSFKARDLETILTNRLQLMSRNVNLFIPTATNEEGKFEPKNFQRVDSMPISDRSFGVEEKVEYMKKSMYSISSCGTSFRPSFATAIECFLNTGNCTPVARDKIVCLNPTLMKRNGNNLLEVSISSNPFEAYFPIPFKDDSGASVPATNDTYSYCKDKLSSLVAEFIKLKERIKLHFHFGDSLELCLYNEEMKNKFHVIFCSMVIERNFGLANVLAATKDCLSETSDAAVLSTNVSLSNINMSNNINMSDDLRFSPVDYIETVAFCPLSMIPTLYGMRLSNHLKLGSPGCVKLHDTIVNNFLTLKWLKAPGYSNNIKLDFSPPLKKAIGLMAESRFASSVVQSPFFNQLYTYYIIMQSLVDRCPPFQDIRTLHSLIQTEVQDEVPRDLRLAWRAEKAWLNGEPVLAYSFSKSSRRQLLSLLSDEYQYKMTSPIYLVLQMPIDKVTFTYDQYGRREPVTHRDMIARLNKIGLYSIKRGGNAPGYFLLKFKDLLDPSFSLLLPKDHGFAPDNINLWIYNTEKSAMNPTSLVLGTLAEHCVWNVITNPTPFSLRPNPFSSAPETSFGLQVMKCSETEDRYELDVSVRGVVISSANDVIVTTDRVNPSWSAHQITLTLPNVEPLVLQVPWPFLSSEVQISLYKNKKGKKNRLGLVLIKSLHDPAPKEFGGRSKWDINLFRPWRDIEEHGTLEMHLDAQFECDYLLLGERLFKETPVLDEVREVIRAIFYRHHRNSFYLFAIYDHLNSDEPVMHLRIQRPVRFSPPGFPLLLVSVLDHQLARQLIKDGKLDRETQEQDFHRLITERVSREVCTIRLSSAEELNVLRYALRVNSTRMRRSVWQSKNLPRYDDNPWMPTFISPLYSYDTNGSCEEVTQKMPKIDEIRLSNDRCPEVETFNCFPLSMCASCHLKKIDLKKCSSCKKVSYCSTVCQKKHWDTHKTNCSN